MQNNSTRFTAPCRVPSGLLASSYSAASVPGASPSASGSRRARFLWNAVAPAKRPVSFIAFDCATRSIVRVILWMLRTLMIRFLI